MANGERRQGLRERVLLTIGCVVTAVWVIAVLVQVAFPTHVVPQEVHGIMFVIASSLFGSAAIAARKSEKNGNGSGA